LGIAQSARSFTKKTARPLIIRPRSAISVAPRSITKKIISFENYSLSAWGWCAYPTRRGYDIAARCPVWAPPSAGAELRPAQQDLANADCILIEGSSMAECHPVGFPLGDESKGARRDHHSCRSKIFAYQRAGRHLGADPRRRRHCVSWRAHQAHYREQSFLPRLRRALHECVLHPARRFSRRGRRRDRRFLRLE
jgi:hypothetical protein